MRAWIEALLLGALLGFVVPFAASKFSEKELIATGLVFLLGIFWRLSDIRDDVRGVAAKKLGYHPTRAQRIDKLLKLLTDKKLTKAQNEELDELLAADLHDGPATSGQLLHVLELLRKLTKLVDTNKRRKKIMRDEHGAPRLVYENEVATALQKGWTLPEFSIVLTGAGANWINAIKAVREVTGLGLEEATELVNGAPTPITQVFTKEEAASIRKKFEDVGAKVEVE